MKNLGYLIAAYAIIWVALFVYIFALGRKLRQITKEVILLRELKDRESA